LSPNGQFDASGSLAGYLYQCRLALLLAIREIKSKPNCHISIEKFDDIAFDEDDYAHCILQAKHHIGAKNLTDVSVDVWKTFRIWIEQFKDGTFTNADTKRVLITTALAPEGGAMSLLRVGADRKSRLKAIAALENAARTSKNQASQIGRDAFLGLTEEEAELLVSTITVMDGSPDLHDVFAEIEGELRIISSTSVDKVAQALEGWWLGAVSQRLLGSEGTQIPVQHIAIKAQEIAKQFGPKGLPVSDPEDLGTKAYDPGDEEQVYVKQMRLIRLAQSAVNRGIQDFYRSNTQRSRWARENLLLDGDLAKYESRLVDHWERRFDADCGNAPSADDDGKLTMGRQVFFWASQQQIEFRNVVETWITAGTFHSLADRMKLGWHPNYADHLGPGGQDDKA
jgi:hypothetical protein